MKVQVAGGGAIDAKGINVKCLRVGLKTQRDSKVVVLKQSRSSIPHEGLLGINFLRDHKHYVDLKRKVIVWVNESLSDTVAISISNLYLI